MSALNDEHIDRARQFIDDILKINAEHGMRNVEDPEVIEAAAAKSASWAREISKLSDDARLT